VRDCIHCNELIYPLINAYIWALNTCVCLCLYLYACIFYDAYVMTIGNSPYIPLDYNIGFVAGSFKPRHEKDQIDDNFTRHTQMVGEKN